MFLPTIAVPDPDDARVVFDALNTYYATQYDTLDADTKARVLTLLIAVHADMTRTDTETGSTS